MRDWSPCRTVRVVHAPVRLAWGEAKVRSVLWVLTEGVAAGAETSATGSAKKLSIPLPVVAAVVTGLAAVVTGLAAVVTGLAAVAVIASAVELVVAAALAAVIAAASAVRHAPVAAVLAAACPRRSLARARAL